MNRDRVLIIEDSRVFRDLLTASIESISAFKCSYAHSLKEAVIVLKAEGDTFFCATIDINLPDCKDAELVELIVDEYPHISPIVLTGEFNKALREDIVALNVADYVTKNRRSNLSYVAQLVARLYENPLIKVLVVDDSATARKQMKSMLVTHRYQVFEAKSGQAALSKLEVHPDISLALVDCYMDEMNGFELTSKIRDSYSKEDLVIIGVSSNDSKQVSAEFIKNGANDFLVKPFSLEEFHCRINQNLELLRIVKKYRDANEKKNLALGTAAHDLRGAIGIIGSIASLILTRTFDAEKEDFYLEKIVRNSRNLVLTLESLLDVSVIENGKVSLQLATYDFSELVAERVSFYRHLAERKSIKLDFECELVDRMRCDKSKIIQVADNLLSNAIKYAPVSSTVLVRVRTGGGWVRLEVFDEGDGISEANCQNLFSAYQSFGNKPSAGESSTGLGLAICSNIVKAHGGSIGYTPNQPKGSCFHVILPIGLEEE